MAIEYVLLLFAIFAIGLKAFLSAPREAFTNSGPHLGARIEQQLETGPGYPLNGGRRIEWVK